MVWQERIKGFIFDLDGVITDSAVHHYKAWKSIADSLNVHFDETDNIQLKGASRKASLEYIINKGGIQLTEEEFLNITTRKNEHYLKLIENLNNRDILPGVQAFILKAKSLNLKVGLGSASKNARMILEKLQLSPFFDTIVDGNDTLKSKPNPEVFLKGANNMGLDPSLIIVFEDSIKGVKAANNGGFISCGIGNEKELSEAVICMPGFQYDAEEIIFKKLKSVYA